MSELSPPLLVRAAIEDPEADDSAEPTRNDFPEPKVDEMHQARMCVERARAQFFVCAHALISRPRAIPQGGTPALPPRAGAPAKTRREGEAGKEGVNKPGPGLSDHRDSEAVQRSRPGNNG